MHIINDNDPALRAPSASWRAIRGYRPHFCDVRLPLDVARDLGVRQYVRLLSSDRRIALTVYYYLAVDELTFRDVSIPRTESNFDEALRDGFGVALKMIQADLYLVRELSDLRGGGSGLKSSRTGYSLLRPRVNRAARAPRRSCHFRPSE